MARKKHEFSRYTIAADAIGVTHLVVGSLIIAIGELTDLFKAVSLDHGGVQFIFQYLDLPIYMAFEPIIPKSSDTLYMLLSGFFIVVAGSVVYGIIAYLFLRFIASLFGSS